MTHSRLALLLICTSFTASAVTGAPAPRFNAERLKWLGLSDWDKPVCSAKDCSLTRQGDSLAVSMAVRKSRVQCCLQRDVEGDFDLVVRVRGDVGGTAESGFPQAGLILSYDGPHGAGTYAIGRSRVVKSGNVGVSLETIGPGSGSHYRGFPAETSVGNPTHLRFKRRSDKIYPAWSEDGKVWHSTGKSMILDLPKKVKIGLIIASSPLNGLKVVFDQFKLTKPK